MTKLEQFQNKENLEKFCNENLTRLRLCYGKVELSCGFENYLLRRGVGGFPVLRDADVCQRSIIIFL